MKTSQKIISKLLFCFKQRKLNYIKLFILEKGTLGSGGNAVVRMATRKKDGEKVAIKILNENAKKSKEKRLRFQDEIKVMLENYEEIEGIMEIIDHSSKDYWYTMPIAIDIKEYTTSQNNHIEKIVDGILELTETLIKLHQKGLSHRDIKPQNIFFFKNRYYLGDFGLVDIPDNPNNLTGKGDRIGAKFTIAPEMFRNPKTADGKKADVYSLSKTLWMLLKQDYNGFDGRYDFLDKSISLHSCEKLSAIHLVEIDELLAESTKNKAEERPSMEEFQKRLIVWKETYKSGEKVQSSNWNFINKYIFSNTKPASCSWTDVESIVNVLNTISILPAYNYMLFSDKGGLDFQSAEMANEKGCIYIYATDSRILVKPKKLYLEVFDNSDWNYFLFELDHQDPIFKNVNSCQEYLVEDKPANYVSAKYAQYGVYDYDSGQKFPLGYKIVNRYIDGKFLIILKQGFYNAIRRVTDGRHGDCKHHEFREYIDSIIDYTNIALSKGSNIEEELNNKYNTNPFTKKTPVESFEPKHDYDIDVLEKHIEENYSKFCFKNSIDALSLKNNSNVKFIFGFDHSFVNFLDLISNKNKLYLCKDGYIRSLLDNNDHIQSIYDRDTAIEFFINIKKELTKFCKVEENDYIPASFNVSLRRIGNPTHLFTKNEIKKLMINADDRVNNTLVIDENGYAHIVHRSNEGMFYPLRHETWIAGNNYVGKYSKLNTLNNTYQYCLSKWLEYLQTDKRASFDDYVSYSKNEEELITEIKEYYTKSNTK